MEFLDHSEVKKLKNKSGRVLLDPVSAYTSDSSSVTTGNMKMI